MKAIKCVVVVALFLLSIPRVASAAPIVLSTLSESSVNWMLGFPVQHILGVNRLDTDFFGVQLLRSLGARESLGDSLLVLRRIEVPSSFNPFEFAAGPTSPNAGIDKFHTPKKPVIEKSRPIEAVPEPASLLILSVGLASIFLAAHVGGRARRKE